MIKSTLKKVFQLIFIGMIAYAGSFVLMEETSEKTEKTEKSEEALHSVYHSKRFGKTLVKNSEEIRNAGLAVNTLSDIRNPSYFLPQDFNIHFIYHTTYLEFVGCPA